MAKAKLKTVTNPYQSFVEGKDPIRVLGTTHKSLVKLVEGLTTRQLNEHIITDKWSMREIIGHLADAELVFSARCRWIMFEKDPQLIGFEQNDWVDGWLREKEPIAETLNRFGALRQSQLRLFKNSDPKDLERSGQHPERGKLMVKDIISLIAGHDINHLNQLTDMKKQLLKK